MDTRWLRRALDRCRPLGAVPAAAVLLAKSLARRPPALLFLAALLVFAVGYRHLRPHPAPRAVSGRSADRTEPPRYALVDLGDVDAACLDNRGRVAGYFSAAANGTHAFLWDRGAFTDLGTLRTLDCSVYDMNETAVVATAHRQDFAGFHRFERGIVFANDAIRELPLLPGFKMHGACAINRRGDSWATPIRPATWTTGTSRARRRMPSCGGAGRSWT